MNSNETLSIWTAKSTAELGKWKQLITLPRSWALVEEMVTSSKNVRFYFASWGCLQEWQARIYDDDLLIRHGTMWPVATALLYAVYTRDFLVGGGIPLKMLWESRFADAVRLPGCVSWCSKVEQKGLTSCYWSLWLQTVVCWYSVKVSSKNNQLSNPASLGPFMTICHYTLNPFWNHTIYANAGNYYCRMLHSYIRQF